MRPCSIDTDARLGKSDHVADGIDVRLRGAVIGVHRDASAVVGFEAGRSQIQLVHVALPAHGVEQRVARDLLALLQCGDHAARREVSSTLSTSSFSRIVTR